MKALQSFNVSGAVYQTQHCYIRGDVNLLQNCYEDPKFCIKQQM